MENLIMQAVGYLVMESDIPSQNLLAGDQVYIDNDPQTDARLIVAVWDDEAHICQRTQQGILFDWGAQNEAPSHAVVIGGALYVSRAIPGYKEATV